MLSYVSAWWCLDLNLGLLVESRTCDPPLNPRPLLLLALSRFGNTPHYIIWSRRLKLWWTTLNCRYITHLYFWMRQEGPRQNVCIWLAGDEKGLRTSFVSCLLFIFYVCMLESTIVFLLKAALIDHCWMQISQSFALCKRNHYFLKPKVLTFYRWQTTLQMLCNFTTRLVYYHYNTVNKIWIITQTRCWAVMFVLSLLFFS